MESRAESQTYVRLSDFCCLLVSFVRSFRSSLATISSSKLSQVTMVVTLHLSPILHSAFLIIKEKMRRNLRVENLALSSLSGGDKMLIQNRENVVANI